MAQIVIENLTKTFDSFTAIRAMNAAFPDGQVTCLLGPSGCGKTTLMRMIVGLEKPTSGRILFDGRDMGSLPPRRRNVGMVFQYPVMYQTLSVEENIALPLKQDRTISASERARRIDEVLDVLDMRDKRRLFIGELDAGSRQKVAVGRAVARRSDIVLFDEPTTNVEVHAKLMLIRAFKSVTQRLKQTIIYVTHDQTEAMTLADNVALMSEGRIIQYDTPAALYAAPATEFAGWFLGNPGMNFPPAHIAAGRVESPLSSLLFCADKADLPSGDYRVGVRPEHVQLLAGPQPGSVPAIIRDMNVTIAGRFIVALDLAGTVVKARVGERPQSEPGQVMHVVVNPAHVSLYRDGERVANITGYAS